MIDLCFSMQWKLLSIILMTNIRYLHYSMQEEDILVHTNAKCYLRTL